MGFAKDFVWGAASAAYQVEGAAAENGKGRSIWDVFTAESGKVFEGHTGNTACDHYHLFKTDIELMKEMGLKAYRFSINWTRLLPAGIGKVNPDGLRFYNELIDSLLEAGIEPYITLFHWDYPYELYRRGGWLNDESAAWFSEYAGIVSAHFSDRVSHFFTINEPQCFIGLGFHTGIHAPGLKCPLTDTFIMAHNVLKGHGAAVRALRDQAKRDLKIGFAPTGSMAIPATDSPEDMEAARRALFASPALDQWTWAVSWWTDPVILGSYPEDGLRLYKPYLPAMSEEDMKLISEPIDFYGQNIYNGRHVRAGADGEIEVLDRYAGFPKTALNWPVTPEALYWGPKLLFERYKKPLYITENGLSCHDVISLDGQVHDPNRIDFLARYLSQLKRASEAGVDVRGYFQWALTDNFEWHSGYAERFGLVFIDYRDQRRIPKDSASWYARVIRENGAFL